MKVIMAGQQEVQNYINEKESIKKYHFVKRTKELEKAMERKKRGKYATIPNYVKAETIKRNILTYGDFTCEYCKKIISSKDIHFEHKIPVSKNGTGIIENINVSCVTCNHLKKDKDLDVFLKLLKERKHV